MILIIAILIIAIIFIAVLFMAGLCTIGLDAIIFHSNLLDLRYLYYYLGFVGFYVLTKIISFIAGIYKDRDLAKKIECGRCEGYCDKCVANEYRIQHNLRGPRKKLPEQMVYHGLGSYSGMCEVCWKYAKEYYTYDKWWINDNHAICVTCYDKRGQ